MGLRHLDLSDRTQSAAGPLMAIDVQCPHCSKAYRLKDEMAGKRVTCANPACRKVFAAAGRGPSTATGTVTPDPMPKVSGPPGTDRPTPIPPGKANGKPPTAKKAPPRPPGDAEALASQVLSDDAGGGAGGTPQSVEMTCEACDHKWSEAWDKQGKNTICPECRHRQKVPVIKKEDWRTHSLPSGAKQEEVPDDVIDLKSSGWVSGESLEKAGVIVEEVEPRPVWHYAAGLVAVVAVVAGAWLAVASLRHSGQVNEQQDIMATAIAAMQELEARPESLPKSEVQLFKAVAYIAAGEHDLRRSDPDSLNRAVADYAVARQALASVGQSDERDALFVELLLAQVALGGDDAQVKAGTRLDWRQQLGGTVRPRVKDTASNVQQELQRTLLAMLNGKVKLDARLAAVRRAARELCRRGQPDLLAGVLANGFDAAEQPDAFGTVCLEVLQETKDAEATFKMAKGFGLATNKQVSHPVFSLAKALNRDDFKTPWMSLPEPKSQGNITEQQRRDYAAVYLALNKDEDAIELAKRTGGAVRIDYQLETLALVAESVADPKTVVQTAAEQAGKFRPQPGANSPQLPGPALARLVQAAARCGQHEAAQQLADAIPDAGLKSWAKAEALSGKLRAAADRKAEEETAAPMPDHPKDYKAGHAWGRLALARNNAAAGVGDPTAFDGWKELRPFGLAGHALGQQDRTATK